MSKISRFVRVLIAMTVTLATLLGSVSSGLAQESDELSVTVLTEETCGDVRFTISWAPDEAESYLFYMDFGDGDSTGLIPTGRLHLDPQPFLSGSG